MSYTLEQKREAWALRQLWWRFPESSLEHSKAWTSVSDDFDGSSIPQDRHLNRSGAEYHIGPTPPRVLSELEGELLEALKEVFEQCDGYVPNTSKATWRKAAAAIQKAESTP